jgi:cold shock CspA family protein
MPNATIEWSDTRRDRIVPEDGGIDTFVHVFAIEQAGSGPLRGQRLKHDPTATRGAAFLLSVMSRANAMDRGSVPSLCPLNHHQPENHRWSDCVPC